MTPTHSAFVASHQNNFTSVCFKSSHQSIHFGPCTFLSNHHSSPSRSSFIPSSKFVLRYMLLLSIMHTIGNRNAYAWMNRTYVLNFFLLSLRLFAAVIVTQQPTELSLAPSFLFHFTFVLLSFPSICYRDPTLNTFFFLSLSLCLAVCPFLVQYCNRKNWNNSQLNRQVEWLG